MSDEKKGTYWCCSADFGDHEETCANYKPVTAREDQPRCNDCGHAPHVGRVCDYGAAHGFEHDGCKCGPEDQPRPIPPDLFGIKVKLDSTMPVGQIDIEDAEGKRTTILEAQGAAPQSCPDCLSDDPLMCKVPIKEFHRHMGEEMLCCPNKFHGGGMAQLDRLARLRQEARDLNPQTIGTPEEIAEDALKTYYAWMPSEVEGKHSRGVIREACELLRQSRPCIRNSDRGERMELYTRIEKFLTAQGEQ